MTLRASARAMAVGFAAFAVLCPERSSAEVVDVCKLSQQLAALFDKIGVIPSSHPQLRLYPNKGNRHPSENTAFLKFSKSGRAPQDKASFELMAPAYVARGTAFVCANYPLCPEVTLPELLDACRRCLVHVRDHAQSWGGDPARVFVSGHSAGGHMAACLMSTQWGGLRPDLPGDLVKGAVAISGIYDLEPIRFLAMNDTLGIDAVAVRDCSPLRAVPRTGGPMVLAVGTGEGEEFNRQQADYAAAWRAAGLSCRTMVLEGENHFSIMDRFARQGTELFEAVCELMEV